MSTKSNGAELVIPKKDLQFVVKRDSREKVGYWNFLPDENCAGTIKEGMKTGDYTLLGAEHLLFIERKRNTGEISLNLGAKSKQFQAEMERGKEFPYRFLICEFGWDQLQVFPRDSGIPPKYWKKIQMSGPVLITKLIDLQVFNGIHIILTSGSVQASKIAYSIFLKVHRYLLKESPEYVDKLTTYRTANS